MNPWNVLATVNSTGGAYGEIYIDDGVSITPNATRMVTLTIANGKLSVTSKGTYSVDQPLGNVTILGVKEPKSVSFSGGSYSWSWNKNTVLVRGFSNTSAWNNPWTLSWQ
jgi:alpha-glucosidase